MLVGGLCEEMRYEQLNALWQVMAAGPCCSLALQAV